MFGKDSDLNEASSKVGVRITEILGKSAKKSISQSIETSTSTVSSKSLIKGNPKKNGIRLGKIMNDLDIELDILVRYLNVLGYDVEADPDVWIPRSIFPLIMQEYANEFIKKESENDVSNALEKRNKRSKRKIKENKGKKEKEKRRISVDPVKTALLSIVGNKIVDGTVTAIDCQEISINIGTPKEGIIPAAELNYKSDLKVGDTIKVLVDGSYDSQERPVIDHRTVRQLGSWDRVYTAYKKEKCVKGFVIKRTNGGLLVDIRGFLASLPYSQIDSTPVLNYEDYIGKWMKIKIIKFDSESRGMVVSHKAVLADAELATKRAEFLANLKEGQVLEGTVKRIIRHGALVDCGYADGLIHISELSRNGITNPKEEISLGQRVDVVVLKVDEQLKRLSLGLKQLN